MGYVAPPPRPARIPIWADVKEPHRSAWSRWRGRNRTLRDVGFLSNGKTEVEWRVEPVMHRGRDRWAWSVWLTFDGLASPIMFSEYRTWHRPGPYKVLGRCRSQDQADLRAREAVEDARARMAAAQFDAMRRVSGGHSERLPL